MPHNRSEAATVDLRRALLGVRVDDEAAWSAARKALLSGADANVSPDDVVGYGRTVLMYAARSGRLEVLHLALACGAEVDRLDQGGLSMGWMGWTALMRAAQGNHPDVITALIEHGANPNRCGQSGVSALMHAAIAGSEEALIRLLAHGAQPNLLSHDGWTALMHAARGGVACASDRGAVGRWRGPPAAFGGCGRACSRCGGRPGCPGLRAGPCRTGHHTDTRAGSAGTRSGTATFSAVCHSA